MYFVSYSFLSNFGSTFSIPLFLLLRVCTFVLSIRLTFVTAFEFYIMLLPLRLPSCLHFCLLMSVTLCAPFFLPFRLPFCLLCVQLFVYICVYLCIYLFLNLSVYLSVFVLNRRVWFSHRQSETELGATAVGFWETGWNPLS